MLLEATHCVTAAKVDPQVIVRRLPVLLARSAWQREVDRSLSCSPCCKCFDV